MLRWVGSREKGLYKEGRTRYSHQGHSGMNYFLQLILISHNSVSYCKFTKAYAVDFGESPHVLTLSENVVSQTQAEVPAAHSGALSSQTPYLDCVGIKLHKVNYAELSITS